MKPIPSIPAIQQQGYSAMILGRQARTPNAVEGFTFNPYPLWSVEAINFSAGCIIAVFPEQVPH